MLCLVGSFFCASVVKAEFLEYFNKGFLVFWINFNRIARLIIRVVHLIVL